MPQVLNLARKMFLFSAILLLITGTTSMVKAQTAIEVLNNTITLDYPDLLTFSLQARSDSPIQSVTLYYGTNATACRSNQVRKPIELTPGQEIDVSWEIELDRFANLPAGAEVFWQWEITAASGDILTTDLQTLVVSDDRYTWKTLEQAPVSVQWVEGGSSFGQQLLTTAVQSLDRLAREAGIEAPEHVLLVVYPSAEDVRNAVHYVPDWTGGLAFTEYNVVLMGIAPGADDWLAEVVPHELAHLVTNQRTFNCRGGSMPTWLSEGLSVYSEGPTTSTDSEMVLNALERNTLDSLESLANGFASDPQRAGQAYAQSGMVVHFLIREYGPEKLSTLFDTIQAGEKIDDALMTAYGFDTYGVDRAWRASLGFEMPERPTPTPTLQGQAATAIPTLALWTQAYSTSTPAQPTLTETLVPTPALPSPTVTPAPVAAPEKPFPALPFPILPIIILAVLGGVVFLGIRIRSKRS